MKLSKKEIPLTGVFSLIFFWDMLDAIYPDIQFIILIFIFMMSINITKKCFISMKFLIMWIFILLHGLLCCIIGNDNIELLLKQLIPLGVYYFIFDLIISKHSIDHIFEHYWRMAVILSLIAVLQEIAVLLDLSFLDNSPLFYFTNYYYRIGIFVKATSVCREPSFLAYLLAPSLCYILTNILAPEYSPIKKMNQKQKIESFCIIFAYFCTFSAVALFGIILSICLIWYIKGISISRLSILLLQQLHRRSRAKQG